MITFFFMLYQTFWIILLECVPTSLAELVTKNVSVPVIGIGAGNVTDGQVLVMHDLLGVSGGKKPKFVKNFLAETNSIAEAFLHAATQAPQPMQVAALKASSAIFLGTGISLASGTPPVFTDT